MEENRKKAAELTGEKFVRSDTGEAEVPPVIIKGGSLDVEHPRVAFDDPVNTTKVVLTVGPVSGSGHVGRIQLVEFRHKQTKEVHGSMRLPSSLRHEDCLILIWDDQV
jgi:hypothetical protein